VPSSFFYSPHCAKPLNHCVKLFYQALCQALSSTMPSSFTTALSSFFHCAKLFLSLPSLWQSLLPLCQALSSTVPSSFFLLTSVAISFTTVSSSFTKHCAKLFLPLTSVSRSLLPLCQALSITVRSSFFDFARLFLRLNACRITPDHNRFSTYTKTHPPHHTIHTQHTQR
jgi:hypothetical protein